MPQKGVISKLKKHIVHILPNGHEKTKQPQELTSKVTIKPSHKKIPVIQHVSYSSK